MALRKRRIVLVVLGVVAMTFLAWVSSLVLEASRIAHSVVEKARLLEENDIGIGDLPKEWREIILEVEDPAFYDHSGVDLSTPGAGLTTITQGLVKTHFFRRFKPGPHAKLKQTIYAVVLDREMEKDLQLTLLLHTAYLGQSGNRRVAGFPEAARVYFGKDLQELTRTELISLVAMLVGPGAFHPVKNPEALAERVSRIEALLAGRCEPDGLLDVYYEGCVGQTPVVP